MTSINIIINPPTHQPTHPTNPPTHQPITTPTLSNQ